MQASGRAGKQVSSDLAPKFMGRQYTVSGAGKACGKRPGSAQNYVSAVPHDAPAAGAGSLTSELPGPPARWTQARNNPGLHQYDSRYAQPPGCT